MDLNSETGEPSPKRVKSDFTNDEGEEGESETQLGIGQVTKDRDTTLNGSTHVDGENVRSVDDTNDPTSPVDNDDEDDDSFVFPPDDDITDMLEGVEYHGSFPTITDRYFTAYYKLNVQRPADDIRVLVHSNRICMLSLAPSHSALQNGRRVTKVDFKVSDKLDRTLNKVSGKSKHGAQPLQSNSNICTISCSDGETYTIKCCMIGKLVEVNEALVENPELVSESPHRGGYLAIVLPNIKLLDKMKESLLTQEQYEASVREREKSGSVNNEKSSVEMDDCVVKSVNESRVSFTKDLEAAVKTDST